MSPLTQQNLWLRTENDLGIQSVSNSIMRHECGNNKHFENKQNNQNNRSGEIKFSHSRRKAESISLVDLSPL